MEYKIVSINNGSDADIEQALNRAALAGYNLIEAQWLHGLTTRLIMAKAVRSPLPQLAPRPVTPISKTLLAASADPKAGESEATHH